MTVRNTGNWIPTLYLEPAHPSCKSNRQYYSLSAIEEQRSKSRSCVAFNAVREESYNVLDIINVFAPHNRVEVGEDDLFPSKARSQRWPLPRRDTRLDAALWRHADCVSRTVDDEPVDADDDVVDDGVDCRHTHTRYAIDGHSNQAAVPVAVHAANDVLDELWFCAGQTLQAQTSSTSPSDADHEHKCNALPLSTSQATGHGGDAKVDDDVDVDADSESESDADDEHDDDDEDDCMMHGGDVGLEMAVHHEKDCELELEPLTIEQSETSPTSTNTELEVESEPMATRSSSMDSLVTTEHESPMYDTYTVNEQFITPSPSQPEPERVPKSKQNTSELHDFLFGGVDTDTDDDDMFANYKSTFDAAAFKARLEAAQKAKADADAKKQQNANTKSKNVTQAAVVQTVPCRQYAIPKVKPCRTLKEMFQMQK